MVVKYVEFTFWDSDCQIITINGETVIFTKVGKEVYMKVKDRVNRTVIGFELGPAKQYKDENAIKIQSYDKASNWILVTAGTVRIIVDHVNKKYAINKTLRVTSDSLWKDQSRITWSSDFDKYF